MSIDHQLLHAVHSGAAFLRLYRWTPPCLSFGRNEPANSRYDLDEIRRRKLDTVRRPTGGRAVWHDDELTYAVAAPTSTFGSLKQTYRSIHEMLIAALEDLGVAASLAPARPGRASRPGAGACFASAAGGEIVVDGRKLVGSAQLREGEAFLQHGSILLDQGQDIVARITLGPSPPIKATSLRSILGRSIGYDEVAESVAAAARERWAGPWTSDTRSPEVAAGDKFGESSWTWRS